MPSATQFSMIRPSMLSAPRISGSLLKSLARLARTRAGSSALQLALRAELRISELEKLPSSMFGAIALSNRAVSGRPPRRLEDLSLPVPKSGWSGTSADFAMAYAGRRATPEQVLAVVLENARKLERMTPSMRVLQDVAEDDARTDAEHAGDRFRVSAPKGVLDGVCIAIKEQTRVRNLPAKGGTAYMDGALQREDATIVRRLREAGAVIVGTTPMTELGMTPLGFNPHRTMPRNPHDTGHVAGGSSTGSGVAVATGLVPIAIGADGGGSIRIPSSLNGVFGIKPTWGRVTRAGDLFGGSVAHLGPLASSTADFARVLEIIAAPDSRDPETAHAPPLQTGTLMKALGRGVRGLTIGIEEGEWADASPEIARAGREAIAALEKEGARVKTVSSPLMKHAPAIGYLCIAIETRAELNQEWAEHADDMSPDLQITMSVVSEFGAVEFARGVASSHRSSQRGRAPARRGRRARASDDRVDRARGDRRAVHGRFPRPAGARGAVPLQLLRQPHGPAGGVGADRLARRLADRSSARGRRVGRSDRARDVRSSRAPRRREHAPSQGVRRSDLAVIVAVRAVDVVAMTVDDVVDVAVVLHGVVAAARTVRVLRIVTFAIVTAVVRAHVSLYGPE